MLHCSHGRPGLEQRDVFGAAPLAPPHGGPHLLLPHVDGDLDEVPGAGPHVLEPAGLSGGRPNKGSVVGIPDEVGVAAKGVSPRRCAQRQLAEARTLWNSPNAADEFRVEESFGDAPAGEAGVEARHPAMPAVTPPPPEINHDPRKGA